MPSIKRALAVVLVGYLPSPAAAQPMDVATLKGHSDCVCGIAYSPDGKALASASLDKTIKLWDPAGKVLKTIEANQKALALTFSPDGKVLASVGGDMSVRLWDVDTGKELAVLKEHSGWPDTVAFSPDGKSLASADDRGQIIFWDTTAGAAKAKRRRGLINRHDGAVTSVAFSPDGKALASAGRDGVILVHDATTGARLSEYKWAADPKTDKAVMCVTFSPDGKTVAASGRNGLIRFWDAAVQAGPEMATLKGHTGTVFSVAFSPDGKTLASGGECKVEGVDPTDPANRNKRVSEIRVWDVATGKELAAPKGHTDWVHSVAFGPDGKVFATGSLDSTIKLWRLNPEK